MPLVDQTQPEFNAGSSARYIGERSFGQSYIAGKDGWLEGIEVGFFNFLGGVFEVAVYKASPEKKFSEDNELGKIMLNNSDIDGSINRYLSYFDISSLEIYQEKGNEYIFSITPRSSDIPDPYGVSSFVQWDSSVPDAYPRGSWVSSYDGTDYHYYPKTDLQFTVFLREVSNEAPTDLTISTTILSEDIQAGESVAYFATIDSDEGELFSYSLVNGEGDTDNAFFNIDGDHLRIFNSPDFEIKPSYSIRLQTKDSGGNTLEKAFVFTVNDEPEPETRNIDLWVSAGSFEAPYYRFYTDAEGSKELTEQVLDTSKSYTFRRLNEATSHPFYISDTGFKQSSSDALIITGDGSPFQGITGNESFKVEFTDLAATTEELLYYCSSHSSMQRTLDLTDGSTETFQVSYIRQIASGLALKLSEAPDLEKLNLYDGTDDSVDLPDLQLTLSDGTAVEDLSVHWKEETNELFLLQTDSLTGISKKQFDAGVFPFQSDRLAEGDYTLIIDARSDGLVSASSGDLIDGNRDGITGDSFTYYFTKKASENLVSIGDTTRGSGQSLGLNGIAHSNDINGLPVLVSTTEEIRSISGNFSYDATVFDNASLVVGHDLPDDWTLDTKEDEVGLLNYTASGTTVITGINQELFRFDAVVSEDAAYGSSTLIEATVETPEDPSLSFESDPSLVVLAYSGDTTGNGSHSSLDASRIQRVVVGLDSGFDAFDTLAPTLIGDTTGNGGLSSLDASRVQQEVVGLPVESFPSIPDI